MKNKGNGLITNANLYKKISRCYIFSFKLFLLESDNHEQAYCGSLEITFVYVKKIK